jgi:hypothetical protein
LSETTTCTCSPNGGGCEASVAEHQRGAATIIVNMAREYDRLALLEPGQLAQCDQSAAASRAVWLRQGADPSSRESVGLLVATAAIYLVLLSQFPIGGAYHAVAAAKLLTLTFPVVEELARG